MRLLARDNECRSQRVTQAMGHVLRPDCRGAKARETPPDGRGQREGTGEPVRKVSYNPSLRP